MHPPAASLFLSPWLSLDLFNFVQDLVLFEHHSAQIKSGACQKYKFQPCQAKQLLSYYFIFLKAYNIPATITTHYFNVINIHYITLLHHYYIITTKNKYITSHYYKIIKIHYFILLQHYFIITVS